MAFDSRILLTMGDALQESMLPPKVLPAKRVAVEVRLQLFALQPLQGPSSIKRLMGLRVMCEDEDEQPAEKPRPKVGPMLSDLRCLESIIVFLRNFVNDAVTACAARPQCQWATQGSLRCEVLFVAQGIGEHGVLRSRLPALLARGCGARLG